MRKTTLLVIALVLLLFAVAVQASPLAPAFWPSSESLANAVS